MSSRDAYVESYLDKCAQNNARAREQEWAECLRLHNMVNIEGVSVDDLIRRLDEVGHTGGRHYYMLHRMALAGKYRAEHPDKHDWATVTWFGAWVLAMAEQS